VKLPRIGPGAIVTAAFIGPGTVTTCTLAGVRFGYALLWALTFATIGTIVLQEMAARLGVVGEMGLGEAIRRRFDPREAPAMHALAIVLVIGAIGIGNAAYQTGNLLGASLGVQALAGGEVRTWALAAAVLASALLWTGSYRAIERVLVGLVIVMSIVFLVTAAAVVHHPGALLRGAFVPSIPEGSTLLALGLVGTTIVPYNLFLHASAARERWRGHSALGEARTDLIVAIALGGIVSMAIVATAAASPAGAASATEMAAQLEPLLGTWAKAFFAIGFFAAGLTSAITAPMAAAYAVAGIFGWVSDLRSPLLRPIWMLVMAAGVGFALAGVKPIPAIVFAQAANGILLPAVAIFLLVVMNDQRLLRGAANGVVATVLGGIVVIVTLLLGVRALVGVLG
jgi:Mn2+/Fe2+ NRAMP family transporter